MIILFAGILSLLLCGIFYFFIAKGLTRLGKVFLFTASVFCLLLSLLAAAGYSFWYGLAVGTGLSLSIGILASSRLAERLTLGLNTAEETEGAYYSYEEKAPKFNIDSLLENYHAVEEPEEDEEIDLSIAEHKDKEEEKKEIPYTDENQEEMILLDKTETGGTDNEDSPESPDVNVPDSAPMEVTSSIEVPEEEMLSKRISLLVSQEEAQQEEILSNEIETEEVFFNREQQEVDLSTSEEISLEEDSVESVEDLLRNRKLFFDEEDLLEQKPPSKSHTSPAEEQDLEQGEKDRFAHFDDLKVEYEGSKRV